eukprot:412495-Prymnesium_polylepis.2
MIRRGPQRAYACPSDLHEKRTQLSLEREPEAQRPTQRPSRRRMRTRTARALSREKPILRFLCSCMIRNRTFSHACPTPSE